MKNLILISLFILSVAVPNSQSEEINIYMWSEYIDPKIILGFEKETGIKVKLSLYDSSEEMLAKVQYAGGIHEFDVMVISNMMVPRMARLELLHPLDHTRIPNRQNLEPEFLNPSYDPNTKYSLAYQWGTVGLMYNKTKLPNTTPSWSTLFDPKQTTGTFLLLDEMRDLLGVTLIHLGYSSNTKDLTQIKAAGQLLRTAKQKPNAKGFENGVESKNRVASGEIDLAVVWNGDALRAISENESLAYVIPKEGSIVWSDVMAIPTQAPHVDAAHQFINHILNAKVGAQLSAYTEFATPNKAAKQHIDQKALSNPVLYPPADVMKTLEYQEDVGKHNQLYNAVWTALKAQ